MSIQDNLPTLFPPNIMAIVTVIIVHFPQYINGHGESSYVYVVGWLPSVHALKHFQGEH